LKDLIPIEGQLIWISKAMMELEEKRSKLKTLQTWVACQKFWQRKRLVI